MNNLDRAADALKRQFPGAKIRKMDYVKPGEVEANVKRARDNPRLAKDAMNRTLDEFTHAGKVTDRDRRISASGLFREARKTVYETRFFCALCKRKDEWGDRWDERGTL